MIHHLHLVLERRKYKLGYYNKFSRSFSKWAPTWHSVTENCNMKGLDYLISFDKLLKVLSISPSIIIQPTHHRQNNRSLDHTQVTQRLPSNNPYTPLPIHHQLTFMWNIMSSLESLDRTWVSNTFLYSRELLRAMPQ